jgi:hypothetical protein
MLALCILRKIHVKSGKCLNMCLFIELIIMDSTADLESEGGLILTNKKVLILYVSF